jgi:hypothetical protein
MRIRSPYLRVVLVVSVPAKNRSAKVTEIFSIVYTGSVLCFSCEVGERQELGEKMLSSDTEKATPFALQQRSQGCDCFS